jgi:hypothetical protein
MAVNNWFALRRKISGGTDRAVIIRPAVDSDGSCEISRVATMLDIIYEAVNAMLLNEFLKAHRKLEQQEAMIACQQKQIEALSAGLQKVSARLEASKPAPQVAENTQ